MLCYNYSCKNWLLIVAVLMFLVFRMKTSITSLLFRRCLSISTTNSFLFFTSFIILLPNWRISRKHHYHDKRNPCICVVIFENNDQCSHVLKPYTINRDSKSTSSPKCPDWYFGSLLVQNIKNFFRKWTLKHHHNIHLMISHL